MVFRNCSVEVLNSLKNNPVFVYSDIPHNVVTSLSVERIYAVFGDWIIFNNSDYIIPDHPAYVSAKIRTIDFYGILQVADSLCCHPEVANTLMNLANMDTSNTNLNHLATSYCALDDNLRAAANSAIPDTYNDKDKMQIVVRHPIPIQEVEPNMIDNVRRLKGGNDMVVINGGDNKQQ